MTISNIKDSIDSNIHKVWETVLAVDKLVFIALLSR